MDIEKLIKRIKCPQIQSCPMDGEYPSCKACQKSIQQEVITALSAQQAENEEMQKKLNEFSEFLCHMTGGMLSKTNYTAQAMISAAEDYQQRVCDNDCDLRADLARVTAERDGAVEEVKRLKAVMRDEGIVVIPPKYLWKRAEWNV